MDRYDYINNDDDTYGIVCDMLTRKGIAAISTNLSYQEREDLCKLIFDFLNRKESKE